MDKGQLMAWQFWFGVGQYIIAAAVGIYVWISNKDKARSKDIKVVEKTIKSVDERVIRLESSSISHDDLSKVYDRVNEVSTQVSGVTGVVKGIKSGIELIHQHLLSGGKKQ